MTVSLQIFTSAVWTAYCDRYHEILFLSLFLLGFYSTTASLREPLPEWTTSYRGPVLIHAGARLDRDCFRADGSRDEDFADDVTTLCGQSIPERQSLYPVKSIVGIALLVDVVTQSSSPWFVGRYGFVFANARPFKEPIRYSGALKLFDVEREVIAESEVKP